jgi:hypothetical protein
VTASIKECKALNLHRDLTEFILFYFCFSNISEIFKHQDVLIIIIIILKITHFHFIEFKSENSYNHRSNLIQINEIRKHIRYPMTKNNRINIQIYLAGSKITEPNRRHQLHMKRLFHDPKR